MALQLSQISLKKVLLILVFIIIVVVLIYAIISFFFASDEEAPITQPPVGGIPAGGLPGAGGRVPLVPGSVPGGLDPTLATPPSAVAEGGRTRVLPVNEDFVSEPEPTAGGNSFVYYDRGGGHFYRHLPNGDKTLLTDEQFFNVQSVSWSPNQDRAVLEFPDGSNIIYDFTKRSAVTLPREVAEPVFTERSNQLIYKTESSNPDENWLVASNADGSNIKFLEPLGANADQVHIATSPDARVVAFFGKPTGGSSSEVILLGQNKENFKSLDVEGLNFQAIYSPDGRRLLYNVISGNSDFNPSLWVADGRTQTIGQRKFDLGIITWIDKCVFSGDSRFVYCAVPDGLPAGAGINPDLGHEVPDVFWRIDLDTGFKTRLAIPVDNRGQSEFSALEIWLSANEDELLFWDFETGGVYKIRLR